MTLTSAVLAAQVALFNFMFGQLLGRYSTTITTEMSDLTVRMLQGFTIVALSSPVLLFSIGLSE